MIMDKYHIWCLFLFRNYIRVYFPAKFHFSHLFSWYSLAKFLLKVSGFNPLAANVPLTAEKSGN